MRSYYRRWAGLAALYGALAVGWVIDMAVSHYPLWAIMALSTCAVYAVMRAFDYAKRARIARKYIGHPLEYLMLAQVKFGRR